MSGADVFVTVYALAVGTMILGLWVAPDTRRRARAPRRAVRGTFGRHPGPTIVP